jgi:hypothetical protein
MPQYQLFRTTFWKSPYVFLDKTLKTENVSFLKHDSLIRWINSNVQCQSVCGSRLWDPQNTQSTTVYVPSSEFGLPHPAPVQASVPPPHPPGTKGWGHTRLLVRGWGESQFRRQEKILAHCRLCSENYNSVERFCDFPPLLNLFGPVQCSGSMTIWCGSGTADPCLWLMDPDPDSDPDHALIVIDLQDANKKLI